MYMCEMYVYVCMYVCMHVCRYACMYVCMYVGMYVGMYVCMYVCMCVRVCGCVWFSSFLYLHVLCIFIDIYTCICIYAYMS